jgi:hypothetical protein
MSDLLMDGFGLWHCRKLQANLGALIRARSCTVLTVCLMGPCKGDTELQETSNVNKIATNDVLSSLPLKSIELERTYQ